MRTTGTRSRQPPARDRRGPRRSSTGSTPSRRPRARDRLWARGCGDARLRAPRDGASDGDRPVAGDDRGGGPAETPSSSPPGAAEFLVAALEEIDLGERQFDMASPFASGSSVRARARVSSWRAGSPRADASSRGSTLRPLTVPGLSRRGPRSASGSVNRPASSALPAIAPSQPSVAEGDEIVERCDAAGGEHGEPDGQDLAEQFEVRAGERAVPCVLVTSSRGDARRGAALGELRGGRRRGPGPAVDCDQSVAHVDRHDESRRRTDRARVSRNAGGEGRGARPSRGRRRPRARPSTHSSVR